MYTDFQHFSTFFNFFNFPVGKSWKKLKNIGFSESIDSGTVRGRATPTALLLEASRDYKTYCFTFLIWFLILELDCSGFEQNRKKLKKVEKSWKHWKSWKKNENIEKVEKCWKCWNFWQPNREFLNQSYVWMRRVILFAGQLK